MNKLIILCVCLFGLCEKSLSQTYFSPVLGFDLMKITNGGAKDNNDFIQIHDKGYSIESPLIGVRISHEFKSNFSISLTSTYGAKNVKATSNNFTDIEGLKFNLIQNQIAFIYSISGFAFGAGASYNILSNIKFSNAQDPVSYNSNDQGLIFLIGKPINKFLIDIYYYKGLNPIVIKEIRLNSNPINSFGILLSYKFDISGIFDIKQECPKF